MIEKLTGFVVISEEGTPYLSSFGSSKTNSIRLFLRTPWFVKSTRREWTQAKRGGCRCVRATRTITIETEE